MFQKYSNEIFVVSDRNSGSLRVFKVTESDCKNTVYFKELGKDNPSKYSIRTIDYRIYTCYGRWNVLDPIIAELLYV